MKNVLVFPCGSEIGLEINRALRKNIHFNIWGGSSVDDHGRFVYKNYISGIPSVDDANFISAIQRIIEEKHIDFIMPAHDSVVLKLSEYRNSLPCKIVTSPDEACRIARSKALTYQVLKGQVPIPQIHTLESAVKASYPLFLKPDVGQGSKGCKKADNYDELKIALAKDPSLMILEYLPGAEYTIDCFTDRHRNLLFVGGRSRGRISNGISVNSSIVNDSRFLALAKTINNKIEFRGAWFFQVKERADGELVLMEIATRIAGTMEMYNGLGVNFAILSLFDASDIDVAITPNDFSIEIDRALCACFNTNIEYNKVYVDFDDTIVADGAVNAEMMMLLYQVKNAGKRIILLSRHATTLSESFKKYHICENLFDEIIHITNNSVPKSSYIPVHDKAIFIDDSFAERNDVIKNCHIPVFSPSNIDVLIDYHN